ncbi:PadR family transcriptional regulator [Nocardia sp. NPDC001965]
MSLQFAILTALMERESTGIELARRFDRSFGYFWEATHQQIYRELERLQARHLVADVEMPGPARRGQPKRFAATAAGIDTLREWLGEIDEPAPTRMAIMVRLRAAAAVGDHRAVRASIEHHLELHRATLAEYEQIERRDFATADDPADALRHSVLKAGLHLESAWVQWCLDVLSTLDGIEHRTAAKQQPASAGPAGVVDRAGP